MRARTRNVLTVAALVYIGVVVWSFIWLPLGTFNVLLVTTVVPLVWLVLAFCRWSAYQGAERYARDVEKVHGPRAGTRVGVR